MTELYIVRHGIAVPHGSPGIEDDDRPLTPKGRKRMRKIAEGLARLKIEPDRIFSSPLPRAWQTAEIVASVLEISDRLEPSEMLRADRRAPEIRDWLQSLTDARLMIVGHNPGLSQLLALLVAGTADPMICDLEKGGVAALTSDAEGKFLLNWISTPRILRRLGRD